MQVGNYKQTVEFVSANQIKLEAQFKDHLDRLSLYEGKIAEIKKDKIEQKQYDTDQTLLHEELKQMKMKLDNSLNHFMNTENYVGKYIPVQIHY